LILKYYLILAASIGLVVTGQLALKAGAERGGSIFEQLFHGYTVIALFAYFIAAVTYMYVLRVFPISVAFPLVSISSVTLVAIAAHYLWREPFGLLQVFAIVLIATGLFLLFRGQ
jgi:multidrug transporter EmrE-like cation transporter